MSIQHKVLPVFLTTLCVSVTLWCKPVGPDLEVSPVQNARLQKVRGFGVLKPFIPKVPAGFPEYPADQASSLTEQGIELGRWLFYDPLLSIDNTISCASCHKPELSFADSVAFSDGVRGQKTLRNSMPLVNLAWDKKFFWDGRADLLEQAVLMPVTNGLEMDMPVEVLAPKLQRSPFYRSFFQLVYGSEKITPERIGTALAQFVRSLISRESAIDRIRTVQLGHAPASSLPATLRGFATLQMSADINAIQHACAACHETARFGANRFENIGLPADAQTEKPIRFKVPSLYNIAYTAPYMHDGSLASEKSVIDHYDTKIVMNGALAAELTAQGQPRRFRFSAGQRKTAMDFLRLFNDEAFIKNKLHYSPFQPDAVFHR